MAQRHLVRTGSTGPVFTRSFFALMGALIAFFAAPAGAGDGLNREVDFDIAPQAVETALLEFSKQAEVQVMLGPDATTGQKTDGVKGRLRVTSALSRLLQRTGLSYERVGDTITVKPAATAATGAASSAQAKEIRLAASDDQSTNSRTSDARDMAKVERDQSAGSPTIQSLDEVVVTGTHIRGQQPVASKVIVVTRADIDRTAHATVQEIVQDLPQNFKGGGANESTMVGGGPASSNTSVGSSINLRGLGPGATLVLLNGRRLAPAGIDASFVDVASLPASAIDRIEILLDGASATYGADAVAGVVNVILRRDYEGAETSGQVAIPTQGGAEEVRAAQTLGATWGTGRVMATYEYYERESLSASDRRATETQDLRSRGGTDFRNTNAVPGTISTGGRTWAIPQGQDGAALTAASFVGLEGTRNRYNVNETRDVLPEQKRHGMFATVGQSIGQNIELTADILASQRDALVTGAGAQGRIQVPSVNPFYVNPAGGAGNVPVEYNFVRDLGPMETKLDVTTLFGGLDAELTLPAKWTTTARVDHGREQIDQIIENQPIQAALNAALRDTNRATSFNAFGDGGDNNSATLDSIRGRTTFASDSRMSSGTVSATGPLLHLPSGPMSLAMGIEYRDQGFETTIRPQAGSDLRTSTEFTRNTRAAYAELRIPILGSGSNVPGFRRLDLSVAARYEDYSDFGSATSPAIGLAWAPLSDLILRVSRTESFKAPTLPSLDESANVTSISNTIPDPQSPTGISRVLFWSGSGNQSLQAETSDAWTAGIEWSPSTWPGVSVEVSYFDIEFADRIQNLGGFATTFLQDPRFADFVIRNPTAEQRAVACSRSRFVGVSPSDCIDLPVAALLDTRPTNTATSEQSGIDLIAKYSFDSGIGTFQFSLNATYLLSFDEALSPPHPTVDVRDTPFQPLALRGLGSVYWLDGPWGIGANIRYSDKYRDTLSVPNRDISSWSAVDLQFRYKNESGRGDWLDGLTVALGIENVFDREPPFFNNSAGIAYDPTNSDVIGRTLSLQLRKNWGAQTRR